ncbi:MAG: DNA-processing protein DprA, partial [Burkholderiaceae bacterium]
MSSRLSDHPEIMPLTDSPQALASWLRLSLESLGTAALHLLRHVGAPELIFARSATQLAAYVPTEIAERLARPAQAPVARQIDHALRWAELDGHTLLPISSADYPAHLLTIGDAPLLLYVDGQVSHLRTPGMAIVGARQATAQGRENARTFAQSLARHGLCVISGLAVGVDAAAHEGALAPGAQGA